MTISLVTENKKQYLNLLLLADEEETMIDKYLERGDLFTLNDSGVKSLCVVTDEGDGVFELQSLATDPAYQRRGYAGALVRYIREYYQGRCKTLLVGTGDCPKMMSIYEHLGFAFSRRLVNYMPQHYSQPIIEDGYLILDKVYLKMEMQDT